MATNLAVCLSHRRSAIENPQVLLLCRTQRLPATAFDESTAALPLGEHVAKVQLFRRQFPVQVPQELPDRHPTVDVIVLGHFAEHAIHQRSRLASNGFPPGQLLNQSSGKRPPRFVQLLRKRPFRDDRRRNQPVVGLFDKQFQQAPASSAARQD